MIILPQTYQPQIASLCRYCGTDYSAADGQLTADPARFVEMATTLVRTLDAWALLPPSCSTTHDFAQRFTSLAIAIMLSAAAVAEELEAAFYIRNIKAINQLRPMGKTIAAQDPQKLIPMTLAASQEEQMVVMGVWVEMPRLLGQIAEALTKVVKAATMPRNVYQQSLNLWTPRFNSHIETTIEARGEELDDFISRAMETVHQPRQQALINHRDHAYKKLDATTIGKLYLEKYATHPEEFVAELRRLSIKGVKEIKVVKEMNGGKGEKGITVDELLGFIVDYQWALRQLEKISTTINLTHVDTLSINDIHDNTSVKI